MFNVYRTFISHLRRDQTGASMVEYGLLVVLVAIVALVAIQIAGSEVSQTYSEIASSLGNA